MGKIYQPLAPRPRVALCLRQLQRWPLRMLAGAGCILAGQPAGTRCRRRGVAAASPGGRPESRLHNDPEDSRGDLGILGTQGTLTCSWYPTSIVPPSCSGRLVSAPGRPGPELPHSRLRILHRSGTHLQNTRPLPFPSKSRQPKTCAGFHAELTLSLNAKLYDWSATEEGVAVT